VLAGSRRGVREGCRQPAGMKIFSRSRNRQVVSLA
jgi:hypothetical protein